MQLRDSAFAVLVAVLWGGNFVAAKFGVAYFPPFFFTAIRFIFVAALMLPFLPRPTPGQMARIVPVALLASLHFSLLFVALARGMDISSSSLVGQLGVPFSCLLGAIFLNDKIGIWRIGGIIIAFIGVAIVAGTPNILEHRTAFFLALGSTFSWGTANIFIKRVGDVASQQLLAWMSLFTVPPLLLLSWIFEGNAWGLLAHVPASAGFALSYTVLVSTLVAYGLWYYLLGKYTVSQVTPFSLLTPVFGIAFGQLFFSETLTLQVVLGGAITIVGVAIIVVRRPKLAILAEAT